MKDTLKRVKSEKTSYGPRETMQTTHLTRAFPLPTPLTAGAEQRPGVGAGRRGRRVLIPQ